MQLEITVILPTFRRPQLLKRAIDSVLAQSYPHFKLCIYDNASGDETEEIVREYRSRDKRIYIVVHDQNIGSNSNFLFGLIQVDTPFFVFLSDDDFFMPTFFEEAMKGFESHPQASLFAGGLIVVDDQHRVKGFDLYEWANKECYSPKELIEKLFLGCPFPYMAAMVFRKKVRDEVGLLNPEVKWHDVEFLMRVFKKYPIIISRIPCVVFLVHISNMSLSISLEEFLELRLCYIKMIDDIFSSEQRARLIEIWDQQSRKAIFNFSLQKCGLGLFEEGLIGASLLRKRYNLNIKEKIFSILVYMCHKNKQLAHVLLFLMDLRRVLVRFIKNKQLKNKITKNELNYFKNLGIVKK